MSTICGLFIKKPSTFENPNFLYHFFKHYKPLCVLNQAPHSWSDYLRIFLMNHGFTCGKIDVTLFIKRSSYESLIIKVYVYDIIFGSPSISRCEEFSIPMQSELKMSMMGEITFFLRLQI